MKDVAGKLRLRLRPGHDDRGASLVEYAFLLALIALVCVGALMFIGGGTGGGFDKSQSCIGAAYSGEALPEGCPD